ncbi:MAG: hypothetical protein JW882_15425 [Deltaproteobacteria bacterium]|nr:hypothetical protein [Deltaproteobacteria bacterium]
MKESQRKKIEEKLKRMIDLQLQSMKENEIINKIPPGTKAIRRRKGSPDKYIA